MESEYDLTLNEDIWERKWFHEKKKISKYVGERKRVSKAPWKIQRENTHLWEIKWLYLHDGIIICHSDFTKSLFISRDRERDRKREPVFCGSLNSLRTLVLGFQKLRNQWSSGSNFFWKFSESQNLCFHVSESKEPMVLDFQKIPKNWWFSRKNNQRTCGLGLVLWFFRTAA